MPYYFHFGQSRELSALHWFMEIRPLPLSQDGSVLALLIQSACRQCWVEACWEDDGAIELCSMLLDRAKSPVSAQELLKRCREGDVDAFDQALLWLQQQVRIEVLALPNSADLTSD